MPYSQLTGYVPPENERDEEEEEASSPNITHGTRLWSIISLVLSSVGILLIPVPAVGIFFGAFGIGFSVFSRKINGYFYTLAVAGIITGVIALASCIFFLVFNTMTEAGLVINVFDELLRG